MNEYAMVVSSMRSLLISRGLYLLTKLLTIFTLAALSVLAVTTGNVMLTEGVLVWFIYSYTDGKVMMLKAVYDELRSVLKRLDPEE